jgi:hypothetical protein
MTEIEAIASELQQLAQRLLNLEHPAPQPTNPVLAFDARLHRRGVNVQVAGTTYTLVAANYFDTEQAQGRHAIYVDVLDKEGRRKVGVPLEVYWPGDFSTFTTEEKPGEPWAASFPLYAAGNAYALKFAGWIITGMGLGTIEEPSIGHHVSYGFVFKERT